MPYDVSGLLEATWEPSREQGDHSLWFPVLSLNVFGLCGDEVSDYLFGLAKHPCLDGHFSNRGLPHNCCRQMKLLARDNDEFIHRYGEGDFGYTYAELGEIDAALALAEAPQVNGSWQHALSIIESLRVMRPVIPSEQWRLIVWANW